MPTKIQVESAKAAGVKNMAISNPNKKGIRMVRGWWEGAKYQCNVFRSTCHAKKIGQFDPYKSLDIGARCGGDRIATRAKRHSEPNTKAQRSHKDTKETKHWLLCAPRSSAYLKLVGRRAASSLCFGLRRPRPTHQL